MKPGIDLTERSDFGESRRPREEIIYLGKLFRSIIFPNWTADCLLRPDKILRDAGVRTISHDSDFPPHDRCECCGRLIPPWRGSGLCKGCDGEVYTGLPRNPEMISNLRDLRV